jgi:hypothetical protein
MSAVRQKRPFTHAPYFSRSDNKRQKATRALHRMAFARLPLDLAGIPSRGPALDVFRIKPGNTRCEQMSSVVHPISAYSDKGALSTLAAVEWHAVASLPVMTLVGSTLAMGSSGIASRDGGNPNDGPG